MNKEQAKFLISQLLTQHDGDYNAAGLLVGYHINVNHDVVDSPHNSKEVSEFLFSIAQALKDLEAVKYELTRYKALHFWRCCMVNEPSENLLNITYQPGFHLATHLGLPTNIPLFPEYLKDANTGDEEYETKLIHYNIDIEKLTKFFLTLSQALV